MSDAISNTGESISPPSGDTLMSSQKTDAEQASRSGETQAPPAANPSPAVPSPDQDKSPNNDLHAASQLVSRYEALMADNEAAKKRADELEKQLNLFNAKQKEKEEKKKRKMIDAEEERVMKKVDIFNNSGIEYLERAIEFAKSNGNNEEAADKERELKKMKLYLEDIAKNKNINEAKNNAPVYDFIHCSSEMYGRSQKQIEQLIEEKRLLVEDNERKKQSLDQIWNQTSRRHNDYQTSGLAARMENGNAPPPPAHRQPEPRHTPQPEETPYRGFSMGSYSGNSSSSSTQASHDTRKPDNGARQEHTSHTENYSLSFVHPMLASGRRLDRNAPSAFVPCPVTSSIPKEWQGFALPEGSGMQKFQPEMYHEIRSTYATNPRKGMDRVDFDNFKGKTFYGKGKNGELDDSDNSGSWNSVREPMYDNVPTAYGNRPTGGYNNY